MTNEQENINKINEELVEQLVQLFNKLLPTQRQEAIEGLRMIYLESMTKSLLEENFKRND